MPKCQSTNNQDNTVILQFVGDVSLNGLFCDPQYQVALRENMTELAIYLAQCHLRIGNWESPLWGDGGVNILKQPRLCTTLDAAKCILPFGLDVALLGNNHVYDCLEKGFENTVQFFKDNNISYLGAGTSKAEAAKPLIVTRKGLRLGLLNYVGAETNPSIATNAGVFLNMIDKDRLFTEVANLGTEVDIVVVNLHCGTELVRYPSPERRCLARRIVEAGAKVVSFHHSHVFQGHERWKEGHIFYSLGNFLFGGLKGRESQQWSKLSRRTAVATCVVSNTGVEHVHLTYLCQRGFILQQDKADSRKKNQTRLNQRLKLTDSKYKRLYQRELPLQWLVFSPFRFISTSGGLIKALRRIRWQHVVRTCKVLTQKTK